MPHRARLALLAAALAVGGFALVAIGAPGPQDVNFPSNGDFGWYAYAPGEPSPVLFVGLGLLGLGALLTAGVIGQWALQTRRRDRLSSEGV